MCKNILKYVGLEYLEYLNKNDSLQNEMICAIGQQVRNYTF